MKALLLDSSTTKIISMVYSQTQILEQEVYLVELLAKAHEPMTHLKAAVFLRPTEENLDALIKEINDPKFAEYHIFFSNIVPPDMLTRLGKADELEVIRQVQEYYADYMAVNEDFLTLGIDDTLRLSQPHLRSMETGKIFDRNVQGILSILLSFKRRPSQIRYQGTSELARRIASDVASVVETDEVFVFRREDGPMLLILDRRDDPITPLLTQWTYQAMVHELLGLHRNRVKLKGAPGVKSKDLDEVVLSSTQDAFFAKNRYANFGELGSAIKEMLDEYQRNSKTNAPENLTSIKDMQDFMTRYPAFRASSLNVSKHVAILGELGRLTDVCKLLDISSLEQEIACSNDHATHKKELFDKIMNPKIQAMDKLRLSLLYVIRYESYDEIREIKSRLTEKGLSPDQCGLLDAILAYAGEAKRAPGLFAQGGLKSIFRKVFAAQLEGVANVYTQHQPLLSYTLDSILKGNFKESSYPLASNSTSNKPQDLFVFMVGGVTYEEACKVAEFNAANPSMRVILGGSTIHNSNSFLKEISSVFGRSVSL